MSSHKEKTASSSYGSNVEFEKPRRLEEETAVYLSQLEAQLDEIDADGVEILVNNVLDEIKHRTASAASDRRTNYIIEKLCYAANTTQLMEIMNRCAPYVIFLSQNRYSSHVVQAILARLCHLIKSNATHDVEDEVLESTVLKFVQSVLESFKFIALEQCGSHVLRSVICLLSGMPVISEKKGKASKHQHSVSLSEPMDKLIVKGGYHFDSRVCFGVPEAFHDSLKRAAEGLLSPAHGGGDVGASRELQELAANTSSCAVLGILLRILFSPHIVQDGPEMAHRIARCMLEYDSPPDKNGEELCAVVYYAMGGDKSGSYFLETIIECASLEFLIPLTEKCLLNNADTVIEFARDGVGNFILQAIMKRFTSEFSWTISSNKFISAEQSEEHLTAAIVMTEKLLSKNALAEPELFPYLVRQKGGVVLWMIKLASAAEKYLVHRGSGNDTLSCQSNYIGLEVTRVWSGLESESHQDFDFEGSEFRSALDGALINKFKPFKADMSHNAPAAKSKGHSNYKSSMQSTNSDAIPGHSPVAILTSRLLGAMLELEGTSCCRVICNAICRLPEETLLCICCSGPMSRCVMDGFFSCKSNGRGRSLLLSNFILPNLVALATHAVGHHTLRQCYEHASEVDKERIVSALANPTNRSAIVPTREGKVVMRLTQMELFARNPSEWKALVVRQKKAEAMLQELEQTGAQHQAVGFNADHEEPVGQEATKSAKKSKPKQEVQVSEATRSSLDTDGEKAGRKRKRKRPSSKKAVDSDVGLEEVSEDEINVGVNAHVMENSLAIAEQGTPESPRLPKKEKTRSKKQRSSVYKDGDSSSRPSHGNKADMQRIKALKSGKMMSIKKINEELEKQLNKS